MAIFNQSSEIVFLWSVYINWVVDVIAVDSQSILGSAIGMTLALPIIDLLKEPTKALFCSNFSSQTTKALREIGAVIIVKSDKCEIDIPNDRLLALVMVDPKKLQELPAPVCNAAHAKLTKLRHRQENEQPRYSNDTVKCAPGGMEVQLTINERKYLHRYSRNSDGTFTLRASFFQTLSASEIATLEGLPHGEDRFTFTATTDTHGRSWEKIDSPLSQWEEFKLGSRLGGHRQGFADALFYYQSVSDQGTPPSPSEARLDLASKSRNSLKYVFSVAEQLFAANKYFPDMVKTCEQRNGIGADQETQETRGAPVIEANED